jgi:hypothetical protein
MPYDVEIDHQHRRVNVIARDPVSLDQVCELLARQATDGVWSYATLHDARLVTWVPTADDVRQMLARAEAISLEHGPRGPVAFVAKHDAVYGMARMYSILAENIPSEWTVFRDDAEARRWLDAHTQPKR